MAIRIVRLGAPRAPDEGPRLGTVRRPPRGVPRAEFARRDFYDTWLPVLAPSPALVHEAQQAAAHDDARQWARFVRQFRREMAQPPARQVLDLLALLSHGAHFSLGCYCKDASRCHRSVLRALLMERGAALREDGD